MAEFPGVEALTIDVTSACNWVSPAGANRLLTVVSRFASVLTLIAVTSACRLVMLVLVYEAIVAQVLDYDYAPASTLLQDRRVFFNKSQEGSQFLPLQTLAPPDSRPERLSGLVVQGTDLDPAAIESTLADCLLSDEVLELQQAPLRRIQPQSSRSA